MPRPLEWRVGKSERFLANLELRFRLGTTWHNGAMKDLSLGGARIVSDEPVSLHDQLELVILLPNQTSPLEIPHATVRWILGHEFGVEFFAELVECKSFRCLVEYVSWLKSGSPLHLATNHPAGKKAA